MKTTAVNKLTTLCSALIAATLVLLPFHALLTIWAGSNFGHYDLFRLWIEFVLAVLAPLAFITLYSNKKLSAPWRREPLLWICITYVAWQIVLGLWALHQGWVNRTALLD